MPSTKYNQRSERRAAKQKKSRIKNIAISVIVIGLGIAYALSLPPSDLSQVTAPRIGAQAPDFTLNDTNGNVVSLSDFRGKPVALIFFHSW